MQGMVSAMHAFGILTLRTVSAGTSRVTKNVGVREGVGDEPVVGDLEERR
jgi:hypothetical protein